MKKRLFAACLAALFILGLNFYAGAKTTVSGDVYYTDFKNPDDFKEWRQYKDDGTGNPIDAQELQIQNGVLVPERPGLIIGAAYADKAYTNVLIETKIDKMARLEFRCDSASPWSDNRFYIEIDFGGAVILRNQDDEELSSTLVQGLVSREPSDVKVRVYGNTVEVYLNEQKAPAFSYVDDALIARKGYCAIMLVWQNPSFEYLRLTELDGNGLYNGKHPITGKDGAAPSRNESVSSPSKKDNSSKPSVSAPTDLSSDNSSDVQELPADVSEDISDVSSNAHTSSAIKAVGRNEGGGLSGWVIALVIIAVTLLCGIVAAILIKRKNAGKKV